MTVATRTVAPKHDWEMHKENAMPIKRGRNPTLKRKVLEPKEMQEEKESLDEIKKAFEKKILEEQSEDPLGNWLEYIKWMQDNFPSGTSELLSLFERCTREFKDHPRYKNNEKYLKIWIGYADMLPNPSEVFKYMRTHGIGERLALYYVATAWTAERRNDFSLADKAYNVGIEKKAKPVEMLKKRHREFQRRMSRRLLNQVEQSQPTEMSPNRRNNDILSMDSQALGVSAKRKTPKQIQGKQFNVFLDDECGFKKNDWHVEKPTDSIAVLPKQRESSKENTKSAGPWIDQGFENSRMGLNSRSRPCPPSKFEVFQENCTNPASDSSVNSQKLGLKERRRKGKKHATNETERLRKNPLRNFDRSAEKRSPAARASKGIENKQPEGKDLNSADEEDLTINTKLAFEDMFDMFASPSMKHKNSSQMSKPRPNNETDNSTSNKTQKKKSFTIFTDSNSSKRNGKDSNQNNEKAQSKNAIPFQVYEECSKPQSTTSSDLLTNNLITNEESKASREKFPQSSMFEQEISPPTMNQDELPQGAFPNACQSNQQFIRNAEQVLLPNEAQDQRIVGGMQVENSKTADNLSESDFLELNCDSENQNLPKLKRQPWKIDESRALQILEENQEAMPFQFGLQRHNSLKDNFSIFEDEDRKPDCSLSKGLSTFEDEDDLDKALSSITFDAF